MQKEIFIDDKKYIVIGDSNYLETRGDSFEPDTINIFKRFCKKNFQVIDAGANIGLTTIALANICCEGKIAAFEPIPITYNFLKKNIFTSGIKNIYLHNFGIGNKNASVLMQGCNNFLAGAFVAEQHQVQEKNHFFIHTPIKTLDQIFSSLLLDRIDFIKMDLEGYELFALEGAKKLLEKFKPVVYLEMNHWCLNIFHRITLPEFRERLLQFFPYVFVIDKSSFLDFTNSDNFHFIAHEHLTKFKFGNIIAGYNKKDFLFIEKKLPINL